MAFVAACSDNTVQVRNTAPNVAFLSPADGSRLAAGTPLSLVAQVGDAESPSEALRLTWLRSDGTSLVGEALSEGDIVSLQLAEGLPAGAQQLTLIVTDPLAASGEDTLSFDVTTNAAPTIAWESPAEGASLGSGEAVRFSGAVADVDTSDLRALDLSWAGSFDVSAFPAMPDAAGRFALEVSSIPEGSHWVRLTVMDAAGPMESSEVSFVLRPSDTGLDTDDAPDDDGDGFSAEEDCDDADSDAYPGAAERCNGVDDDCDGARDDGVGVEVAVGAATYLSCADYRLIGEEPYDFAGWSVASAGDVDGDGRDDVLVGAYGHAHGGVAAGAAYLFLGSRLEGVRDLDLSSADVRFDGEAVGDRVGWSMSAAGDLDGDGLADLAFGAPEADFAGAGSGVVYVVLGSSLGASPTFDLADSDFRLVGESAGDGVGLSVASAGDMDADGRSDLWIGAPRRDVEGRVDAGTVYLVHGEDLGGGSSAAIGGVARLRLTGVHAHDFAGVAVASLGDIDGDGLPEVLVGAHGLDAGGANAGGAYLIGGGRLGGSGVLALGEADFSLIGDTTAEYAGSSVVGAGDVDGGGLPDVVIGASRSPAGGSASGQVYVVFGETLDEPGVVPLHLADRAWAGAAPEDRLGHAVSAIGDFDGDGRSDLWIGAFGADDAGPLSGAAYLVPGSALGGRESRLLDVSAAFLGEESGDSSGWSVASAGDVNGDGREDLLVGAVYNRRGGEQAGTAYIVLGRR